MKYIIGSILRIICLLTSLGFFILAIQQDSKKDYAHGGFLIGCAVFMWLLGQTDKERT